MAKKICLIHDMFLYRWGAERFNIMMARALGADLAALFFDVGSLDPRDMGFTGEMIAFGQNIENKLLRQLVLKWNVLFRTKFLQEYDTIIFSNDSLSAIRNARKDARKIYYAHSIPRYLFDARDWYYQKVPLILRPIYVLVRAIFERMYFRELEQVDAIYTNSSNLAQAIRKYLGRESVILHAPVDTDYFVPLSPHPNPLLEGEGTKEENPPLLLGEGLGVRWREENYKQYYLSFSKFSTMKRVAEVVRAFREMPDKRLVAIYGANDPQKDEILALGADYPNITFLILKDNNDLPKWAAGAIATMFIAKNEDFGMVSLESMSCGTPVIGVREGGIQETIIHNQTGILIEPDFSITDICDAVRSMSREQSTVMSEASRNRALEFGHKKFEERVRKEFLEG